MKSPSRFGWRLANQELNRLRSSIQVSFTQHVFNYLGNSRLYHMRTELKAFPTTRPSELAGSKPLRPLSTAI